MPADGSVWEPVGTPAEYLLANLTPPALPSLGGPPDAWSGELDTRALEADCVVDRSAEIAAGADLARCVVWENERVASDFVGRDGVYGDGRFHPCLAARNATVSTTPSTVSVSASRSHS